MPSTANSILKDYEILFKHSKKSIGFFSKLFKKSKSISSEYCPFCKVEVNNEKTKYSHRETCWKLHVIYISRYEIFSRILKAKLLRDLVDKTSIDTYNKMLSKLDKLLESASSKWELKYSKSLKNSMNINLSDFEFIKPITKGGYGQIFLMKDKYTGKMMCSKIISISEAIQRSCLTSYVSERNLLLRCDSQQIIQLYYSFRSEFFIYQIMEYMESGDISAHLELSGQFSEPLVKDIIANVLLALQELENKGIIHGDIKLENILYSREKEIVKLADFGLAVDAKNLLVLASSLGTPEYMAPEQILNGRKGFESDIWAVGVCMYEMLLGIPPYYDENPEKIFSKIINSNRIDFDSAVISNDAKELIIKLLDGNYKDRISLRDVMNHPFFYEIDWSKPPKVILPIREEIFEARNKRYNSLQYYNKITISTELVTFENGVFNQNTSIDNQVELLNLFPMKNLNTIK